MDGVAQCGDHHLSVPTTAAYFATGNGIGTVLGLVTAGISSEFLSPSGCFAAK
jgi:hypothetical protein